MVEWLLFDVISVNHKELAFYFNIFQKSTRTVFGFWIIAFFVFPTAINGQNLVPNGGFEKYHDKGHCKYWTEAQFEFNHFYHRNTHEKIGDAANGDGYHCLCMYGMDVNEFMHVALTHRLEKGKVYKLSMNVRMSHSADEVHKNEGLLNFKRLDWYFTSIPINVLNKLFITAEPSASFPFGVPHSSSWRNLTATYIANGDEEFLTIGNITRLYEKIKFDEESDSLKNIYAGIEALEIRECDSVREHHMREMPKSEFNNADVYSMNSLVDKKKMSRKKRKQYDELVRQNAVVGHKIYTGQEQVKRRYKDRKFELAKLIEAKKNTFAVNVCFDDISIEEIIGERGENAVSLLNTKPEEGKTIVLKNVLFNTNKYDILDESQKQLDEVVSWLEKNPRVKIQVSGHTDNVGGIEQNNVLSFNRAKEVANYLIQQGINKSRITYKGYGSKYALADNTNEMGRALNRRVEITIVDL